MGTAILCHCVIYANISYHVLERPEWVELASSVNQRAGFTGPEGSTLSLLF